MIWAHRESQYKGNNYCLSFLVEVCVVLQCVFGHDFLSPRTTIVTVVLGIEKYVSAGMSCCSDDLAQLLDL